MTKDLYYFKNNIIICSKNMRSKKLILVSHCVLNQNSVVCEWERAEGAFPIAKNLVESGIGIIQLPCPELYFKGLSRPPMTYEEYNTKEYRQICQQMAKSVVAEIKNYIDNDYLFVGIIGIYNSPTCSITGTRGVFMEEFFKLCDFKMPFFEIPEEYSEQNPIGLEDLLECLAK